MIISLKSLTSITLAPFVSNLVLTWTILSWQSLSILLSSLLYSFLRTLAGLVPTNTYTNSAKEVIANIIFITTT